LKDRKQRGRGTGVGQIAQKLAFAVNKDGPAHLADVCKKLGVPLIHLSTDYVFDGNAKRPYVEEDRANPIGIPDCTFLL
jgi:dTDP-4-dehydrorhamnose reductase